MVEFLIVAGVAVMAVALLTFTSPVLRKLGGLCVLLSSFLGGYFLRGEKVWVGVVAALSWFFMPWLEILTRIRRLRLPLERRLRHQRPPSRDRFPGLPGMTKEIEAEGFEFVEDTGWEWDELRQFVRVFYHAEKKMQAAISLNEQAQGAFAYVSLSSRAKGSTWMTWNYPFAPTMKFSPDIEVNRVLWAESFLDLLQSHEGFVGRQGFWREDYDELNPETLGERMARETRQQIDHNLDVGLIELSGEGTFKYSWRGMFFLWFQFLKDLVRLS